MKVPDEVVAHLMLLVIQDLQKFGKMWFLSEFLNILNVFKPHFHSKYIKMIQFFE